MRKVIDLVGQRFGRLVVIEEAGRKNANAIWKCQCDCGNEYVARSNTLRRGVTTSCGCVCREKARERATVHGMTGTTEFETWSSMVQRCSNPAHEHYKNYGARGIRVCERWSEFKNFYTDMGAKPKGLTLDRIDNHKGYSPDNCRWTDARTQAANTRRVEFSATGIVGVWKRRDSGKYRAVMRIDGTLVSAGTYECLDDAVRARRKLEEDYRQLGENSNVVRQSA